MVIGLSTLLILSMSIGNNYQQICDMVINVVIFVGMKHGSLFSGIGGFDLAAEWMGWENVFHCEINEFGRKVLNYYWPESVSLADIHKAKFKRDERGDVWVRMDGIIADTENTRTRKNDRGLWERSCGVDGGKGTDKETRSEEDNTEYLNIGPVDIITGGFPCQPFSMAGKRKGTEDERHLWPQMLRAIREIQPRWVVGENVSGIVNWDGGVVFEQVHTDLESQGYEVQAYILPACGVNAPHRRDRVWFVAKNTKCNGCLQREPDQEGAEIREQRNTCTENSERVCESKDAGVTADTGLQRQEIRQFDAMGTEQLCEKSDVTDTNSDIRREGGLHTTEPGQAARHAGTRYARSHQRNTWDNFPTQSPVCGRNDGIPSKLVGITFSKHRNESIKAYGNAIVPQVCFMIFKSIQEYEKLQGL